MNIQDLTLEQISVAILFLAAFIGGVKYLKDTIEKFIERALDSRFRTVNSKLDEICASVTKLDTYCSKNFLVRYLADLERDDTMFDAEKQRFWEEYDHYINDLKENSYIKEWVAKLKDEGKLKR